jgi:hypothetical protein
MARFLYHESYENAPRGFRLRRFLARSLLLLTFAVWAKGHSGCLHFSAAGAEVQTTTGTPERFHAANPCPPPSGTGVPPENTGWDSALR